VLASRLHWQLLIGTIVALMAIAWLVPVWMRAPDVDESRILAGPPVWPRRAQDVDAFRKAADAYVADRFPIRPHLIAVLNRLRMLAGVSGSTKVIIGRSGWLFYNDDSHLGPARGDPKWTAAQARAWLIGLAGRTEYLRARGVPYILLVPPMKETVYPQFAPGWFKLDPERAAVRMNRLARETGAGDMLYLYAPIRRATDRGVKTFSIHDTHWTGLGAYEGYVALMRRLQDLGFKDGPRPLSDFAPVREHVVNKPRNLALMLGVASFVDVDYPERDDLAALARNRTTYLSGGHDWTAPHVIDTGQVGKPVLLMTMDSFSNALLPYLYGHFSRIVLAHSQDGFWRPDLIERFKPDIVMMEMLESGLSYSLDPAPPASPEVIARIDRALGTHPPPPPPPKPLAPPKPAPPATPDMLPPSASQAQAIAGARITANCNVEIATLTPQPKGEAAVLVSGWISELAAANTDPVGFVRLSGPGGDVVTPVRVDLKRPDVAAHFKVPAAVQSGFTARAQLPGGGHGPYSPWIYRRAGAGWITCKGQQVLTP